MPAGSVQFASVDNGNILLDCSNLNFDVIKKEADTAFKNFFEEKDIDAKRQYLEYAMSKYFLLTKLDNTQIFPFVQLGRIYDGMNNNLLAKECFNTALNMNAQNSSANFYFGEFYFKRKNYVKALNHYNIAYKNGLSKSYILNLRLAVIHEKIANLYGAKNFYEVSYNMKPNKELHEKIRSLSSNDYQLSGSSK